MRLIPLPPTILFDGRADVYQTFSGKPIYYRLKGPVTLMRLVQLERLDRDGLTTKASSTEGEFWFEQELFGQLQRHSEAELLRQAAHDKKTYLTEPNRLSTLYMRFTLRDNLAISKDWTKNFDAYVTLKLGPSDAVLALVGRVKAQPYYSEKSPDHDAAKDLVLPGAKRQYVINFRSPHNKPLTSRITRPTPF